MNLFIAYPANDKTFESFQEEYSGDSEASGRETHLSERASHRGHGGHRGGFLGAMVRAGFRWTSSLLGGKHAHRGEHRTEVTEVTEEDFGGRWCERALGGRRRFWAANKIRGEHRTEVRERSPVAVDHRPLQPPEKSGIITVAGLPL
jgi:hypothetical protein